MRRKGGESICDCGGGEADNNLFCQDTESYFQNGCSSTMSARVALLIRIQVPRPKGEIEASDFIFNIFLAEGLICRSFDEFANPSKLLIKIRIGRLRFTVARSFYAEFVLRMGFVASSNTQHG